MNNSAELCRAAFNGDTKLTSAILETGVDINEAGDTWNPLHSAIENDQPAVVSLLIEHGADKELMHNGMTPLAHAVEVECDSATQEERDFTSCSISMIDLLVTLGCKRDAGIAMAVSEKNHFLKDFIAQHKAG